MSKSVPFLKKPANTNGWVGDAEFDPFGLSEYFDIKWMRESEIKHSRISMLAVAGFVVQQFITIPGYTHVDDSTLGPSVVGLSAMLQIVAFIGYLEWVTNNGNVTMENMFNDPARVPGVFGFDPMGLGKSKSPEQYKDYELKEITNGRLAMLAIGGMIHHNWITGEPLF